MTYQELLDRAKRIRTARERIPTPSYQKIAQEVGCAEKTVYNVLTGKTHKERFHEAHAWAMKEYAATLEKLGRD